MWNDKCRLLWRNIDEYNILYAFSARSTIAMCLHCVHSNASDIQAFETLKFRLDFVFKSKKTSRWNTKFERTLARNKWLVYKHNIWKYDAIDFFSWISHWNRDWNNKSEQIGKVISDKCFSTFLAVKKVRSDGQNTFNLFEITWPTPLKPPNDTHSSCHPFCQRCGTVEDYFRFY